MKRYFTLFLIGLFGIYVQSQKIKFPESFRTEKGMFLEPLYKISPDQPQTKGLIGNPGLVSDSTVLKRFRSDYKEVGIEAIYYEYYGEKTASSALHVTKYISDEMYEKAVEKLEPSDRQAILILKPYIIKIGIVEEKNRAEQINKIIKYFERKLNAKLVYSLQPFEPKTQQTTTVESK